MSTWGKSYVASKHFAFWDMSWNLSENFNVEVNDEQNWSPSFLWGQLRESAYWIYCLTSLSKLYDTKRWSSGHILYPIPSLVGVFYILAKENVPVNLVWYARQFHIELGKDNWLDASLLKIKRIIWVGYKICPDDHYLASWDLSFDDKSTSKGLIFLEHAL